MVKELTEEDKEQGNAPAVRHVGVGLLGHDVGDQPRRRAVGAVRLDRRRPTDVGKLGGSSCTGLGVAKVGTASIQRAVQGVAQRASTEGENRCRIIAVGVGFSDLGGDHGLGDDGVTDGAGAVRCTAKALTGD